MQTYHALKDLGRSPSCTMVCQDSDCSIILVAMFVVRCGKF